MIPEPSKRPIGFPIPAEALPAFCHPILEPFTRPVHHNGQILVANGYCALRLDRFRAIPEEDFEPASQEFLDRFDSLPWKQFAEPEKHTWRMLDDERGKIYKFAPKPFIRTLGPKISRADHDPAVCVAGGPVVPLALIQIIARLPRCEVRMSVTVNDEHAQQPLLFRFSGGTGLVPVLYSRDKRPVPRFKLLTPRTNTGSLSTGFR